MGSYNTLKTTLPYLVESANKHRVDPKTRKPTSLPCTLANREPRYTHPLDSYSVAGRHRRADHFCQRNNSLQDHAIPDSCVGGQGRRRRFVAQRSHRVRSARSDLEHHCPGTHRINRGKLVPSRESVFPVIFRLISYRVWIVCFRPMRSKTTPSPSRSAGLAPFVISRTLRCISLPTAEVTCPGRRWLVSRSLASGCVLRYVI